MARRQTSQPRTVLGLFWAALALVDGSCLSAVLVLAKTGVATYLIPPILIFAAVMTVLVLVGIFAVMLADPSKLMLGQVSGSEYYQLHRVRLGNSDRGEHEETLLLPDELQGKDMAAMEDHIAPPEDAA